MVLLRSRNEQQPFPSLFVQRRLLSVVYDGPSVKSAVVIWSLSLIERAGAVATSSSFLCRVGTGSQMEVSPTYSIFPRLTGSSAPVGGAIIVDLNPGDVLGVFGSADNITSFDVAQNGLTIVVL